MSKKYKNGNITLADISRARTVIAKAIEMYGDVYLPIFIRLNEEYESAKRQDSIISLALRVAKETAFDVRPSKK
jgi:hypothetical protein